MHEYFLVHRLTIKNRGFTLIELLITTVIIGILSAVSMPVILANIGKARETEATSRLGAIVRSQHAYHFQFKTFATTIQILLGRPSDNSGYYSFPDPSVANDALVKHRAIPNSPWDKSSRSFAGGTYYDASVGSISTTICRAKSVGETVAVGDSPNDNCTNDGVKLH